MTSRITCYVSRTARGNDRYVGKKSKKSKETCSVLLWHKTYIKRIRQRFGLSKYQMLWITFGKGLVIGFLLAFVVHAIN